jgi:hypothetical protein
MRAQPGNDVAVGEERLELQPMNCRWEFWRRIVSVLRARASVTVASRANALASLL